jgi:polyisoprenyl-phosphate glycosyltransferase
MSCRCSVVVPCYGAPDLLPELHHRLGESLRELCGEDYELILVDDACPRDSWSAIRVLAAGDQHVRGLRLSRNFGQHYAIAAGLAHATSERVVVMDCDLQDDPQEIGTLWQVAEDGHPIVLGARHDRRDGWFKRLQGRCFYQLLSWLTDTHLDPSIGNYGIYQGPALKALRGLHERLRFLPVQARWVGFAPMTVPIAHAARARGRSAYSLRKLADLAFQVAIAHSNKPLSMIVQAGLLIAVLPALLIAWLLLQYFSTGIPVQGWTSLMLSVWFLGGALMATLGVVGLYVGRIFEESKGRPHYLIWEDTRSC